MFDTKYQRSYVWTQREQQNFFKSILSGYPVGHISLEEIPYHYGSEYTYEVVDGKQRLTTLKMFFNGDIPIYIEGHKVFYQELSRQDQRKFKSHVIPAIIISRLDNEKDKLQFFYDINFSGVPQSEKHKIKIEEMISNHTS